MNINKLVKDINSGNNLKENAGLLACELGKITNKCSLVNLAFSYSIMYETIDGTNVDPDIDKYIDTINDVINGLFSGSMDGKEAKLAVESVRDMVVAKVDALTAYTDVFQIYEYVLNRIKGRYEDYNTDFDIDALVEKCFGYMFSDTDNAAVNERIKDVLSQLPVRMTKQKFFETVGESMTIYKGSDLTSLKLYDYMLRTSGMIYKKEDDYYKDLFETAEAFATTDYENLTKDEFDARFAKLTEVGEFISDAFDRLSLLEEVINNLLAYAFTLKYEHRDSEYEIALSAVKETLDAFSGKYVLLSDYTEETEKIFSGLEGTIELTAEDYTRLDAARETIMSEGKNIAFDAEIADTLKILEICSLLMSESRFVDYNKFGKETGIADEAAIKEVRDALIADYDKLFGGITKRVRRAVIAQAIKNMPVFLDSKTEIEQYIRYALESCTDKAELAGCVASLKLITETD